MFNKELFVKYHWKQTMILGVVAIVVVGWQVALEDSNIFNKKSAGAVKGEAVVELEINSEEAVLDYQQAIKNIVREYLEQRANFNKPHQDWLFLINKTKYKTLGLSIPTEYKGLHVKIVTLLDMEYTVIMGESETTVEQINQKWQELLEQYFWLNN